ncbi:MAG: hypothetical protein Q8L59_11210 [Phenylobacterium sp.]|uniref:hypothetical protein n=1 Tax=Phenylobacterium sp. TaxID=1871053 RepID=UPI0027343ADF|nr:hypothetical protein [Phenylobacterium sp.]MDP1642743.1 hypothetical protein [Phenylobacterium sp.]MDP3117209.1 hypothetical protein [Phenylobacterium sp.]
MRAQLRRELFPQPAPSQSPPLSADHMAEALILAAIATGEIDRLQSHGSAAVAGLMTLRARWIALAALLALHPEAEFDQLARPLNCAPSPLRQLARMRGLPWWSEGDVQSVFIALAERWSARAIAGGPELRETLAVALAKRTKQPMGAAP